MSTTTEEIIQVCEALPDDKRAELVDFARFLLALRAKGFTEQEVDRMSKQNPARLLGLP